MPAAARLLLVDDEAPLIRALRSMLTAEGYAVEVAGDGQTALARMASDGFDAMILDLGLPDMDGKDVIVRVRQRSLAPIVVLSARGLEEEKIAALDAGADDYISKPFPVGELLARVRAALRGRLRRSQEIEQLSLGDLVIHFDTRRATAAGLDVRLTQKEFDLLLALARAGGRILSHQEILNEVWGPDRPADTQSVRVLVAQLRQKIEADTSQPKLIETVSGRGYRLVVGDRK